METLILPVFVFSKASYRKILRLANKRKVSQLTILTTCQFDREVVLV